MLQVMQSRDLQVLEGQLEQLEHQVHLGREEISVVLEALGRVVRLEPEGLWDQQGVQEPRVTPGHQDLLVNISALYL